ncbi:MAG: MBL fold metallo-hydrolase [Phycisphaeraceae bacterium]|nr:MBL fold metallo-hydrolase [Phycisphaeraceae bacterium]
MRASEPHPTLTGFSLGPFETNCYVVAVPDCPVCWIVDAGFGPSDLIDFVQDQALVPDAVILTHAHADHIAGVDSVLASFPGTRLLIHEAERAWLDDPQQNLSASMGFSVTCRDATGTIAEGDVLSIGGTHWRVLHTPGHSPGGISLVHDASHQVLVGDALFAGSIGRTDFPTSDHALLERSIRQKLYALPAETVVFPGHGPTTTIGRERLSNPFVRAE